MACMCGYLDYGVAKPARESALKIPGLDRGKQSRYVPIPEKSRQDYIAGALKRAGCIVMEIGKHNANRCGNTEGCPDIFFTKTTWQMLWQPLEVKQPTGKAREQQKKLIDLGVSVRIETATEALAIMRQVDERMKQMRST